MCQYFTQDRFRGWGGCNIIIIMWEILRLLYHRLGTHDCLSQIMSGLKRKYPKLSVFLLCPRKKKTKSFWKFGTHFMIASTFLQWLPFKIVLALSLSVSWRHGRHTSVYIWRALLFPLNTFYGTCCINPAILEKSWYHFTTSSACFIAVQREEPIKIWATDLNDEVY